MNNLQTGITFGYPAENFVNPWDDVEVHPIWDDGNGNIDAINDKEMDHEAAYWSVYLHQTAGGIICICDCETEQQAMQMKELIETIYKSHKPTT